MDYVFSSKEKCCGCTACLNSCPKNAIKMQIDQEGYCYPQIDKNLCINCGICQKICQFNKNEIVDAIKNVRCFALKHKDLSVIKNSRSAGAFTAFSDFILQLDGVVYGVQLDSDMVVRHHRATTKEERDTFRESKYVQSDINEIFKFVANDLKDGKYVMFTGTGCQCDGLRSFLLSKNFDTKNLFLVDVVCHGVPSPKMFKEYLQWNERKFHSLVVDFKFRDKQKFLWSEGIEKITFKNKKVKYQDYFTGSIFDFFIRPCCYNCKYTTPFRNSDITFADFWGSEKAALDFTDIKNGCSLVLLHSAKAENIFNLIKEQISFKEVNVNDCLQPRLISPRIKEDFIEKYWSDYINNGFDYVIKKYGENSISLSKLIKRKIRRLLKKIIRLIQNKE